MVLYFNDLKLISKCVLNNYFIFRFFLVKMSFGCMCVVWGGVKRRKRILFLFLKVFRNF